MHRRIQDERAGRMRVDPHGDLEGSLAAVLHPENEGCRLGITQEVPPTKALPRRFDPVARPAFRVRHTWMMRREERGLRAQLDPARG